MNRREFLRNAAVVTGGLALGGLTGCAVPGSSAKNKPFKISLAEWSLHRTLFGRTGVKMTHMDFPQVARNDFGIDAIELVNQFFKDKAQDQNYLREFKNRADSLGVKILLIMIDGEGALGDPDPTKQQQAVENHYKWVEAAKFFGCHSIRVNAETAGVGTYEEQMKRAADGLRRLSQFASRYGLNVIVENHGHLSSNGAWLAGVMRKVGLSNCGTLPDFGNFNIAPGETYDRYKGVEEMMPFAKAVSAKSNDFDAEGNEIHTDYRKMMRIVLNARYRGYVGIEYEGNVLSEHEGIRATKRLLERVRAEIVVS